MKSRKRSAWFVIHSYSKDSAFTAVKRDGKFWLCEKVTICQYKVCERGTISVKNSI